LAGGVGGGRLRDTSQKASSRISTSVPPEKKEEKEEKEEKGAD